MKRFFLLISLLLLLPMTGCRKSEKTVTLNVYNWGQYISDGSEDTLDVNAAFEEYYYETYGVRVKVNYTTYASNEDMYNKLKTGATSYDVVVPSDYMIARMISEGMLEKLDFKNIPNYQYIGSQHKGLFYDPQNAYSVPYTYGMVGIIYNTEMTDAEDVTGWDVMWNEKYKGKILQFNNPRDAFGTAMYRAGIDVNTTLPEQWDRAAEALSLQKPLIQSYVMDEIFNKMKNGSAAIAPYYAGDFLSMYEDNDALAFLYPPEGTNVYMDAFCIPTTTRQKEVAERYIDFMLSEKPAVANAEYTYYASPNTLVTESEEYRECMAEIHPDAFAILYPENDRYPCTYYENLPAETLSYSNTLWEKLKIQNSIEPWIYVLSIAIVAFLIALMIWKIIRKKMRERYY